MAYNVAFCTLEQQMLILWQEIHTLYRITQKKQNLKKINIALPKGTDEYVTSARGRWKKNKKEILQGSISAY